MTKLWSRVRDDTIAGCLWAQRFGWLVPAIVRTPIRRAIGRRIGRTAGSATDEWPRAFVQFANAGTDRAAGRIGRSPPIAAAPAPVQIWRQSSFVPGLHCAVVAGTLDVGGLDRVAGLLGRRLPSYGLATTVLHAPVAAAERVAAGERLARSLGDDGVPVVKLGERDGRKWLATHRPDVISLHGGPDWLLAAAAEARIPIVETLHGAHSFFGRETWPAERLRSRGIAGFVAVSDLVRRQYLRANPVYPADRVVTIPNGVDDQHIVHSDRSVARTRLGIGDEFLFVSLGRYHLQKNTFGLVAAFADVARAHSEAHLLTAGRVDDPAYFEQVRRLRDGLPCAARIHLHGHCEDASAVLAAADAFVLDSFFEGWSLASMEALFAGLPVVISEVGGAREQLGDALSRGFVVDNPLGDPEAMDWRSMARARFRAQANRTELVAAMCAIVAQRDRWANARPRLQKEATARFCAETSVRRHAEILVRAAVGENPLVSAGADMV